jgi:type I restriction enzyme M protein
LLTDPKLRSQVDQLWDKFWSGGLPNPLDSIEQFSYLLFLKRLDEAEDRAQRRAERLGKEYTSKVDKQLHWSFWTHLEAKQALEHLKSKVFPALRTMSGNGSSFERYMTSAECKINSPGLLIEACRMIDAMQISARNQDVQGDLYEYLLGKLNTAGISGQFRTPRHIIRMMVQMIDPKPRERTGDLAAGTCGFLVNAYQHILEKNTSPDVLTYDEDGQPHNLIGDQLSAEDNQAMRSPKFLRGFDNDSGMTMLRIGSMNLMLHGIESPQFFHRDTLSQDFADERDYDVILMNPPFKGAVDKNSVSSTLPSNTTKSELLFVHLILRALDMGGRCAVIVPDGVLFGSSRAHIALREKLVEENRLDGVVSMPGGIFKPYAGVSTAVLFFTRGATTNDIWFYDMAHDGFSLDDKRQPVGENDIPDIISCWQKRFDRQFQAGQAQRMAELKAQLEPLRARWLAMQGEIHRLQFEKAIASEEDGAPAEALVQAQTEAETVEAEIAPLHAELDRLGRQFWVKKDQVKTNKYDLSASRYRQIEPEVVYYEKSKVTLTRMAQLEQTLITEISELQEMLR